MRYAGIDYGKKRVGVAISDEQHKFAFPLAVLDNTEELVQEIVALCAKNDVGVIIVGESKNFAQEENEIMKDIKPFAALLEKTLNMPVHLHPEFMTSEEARRLQGENSMHDASAAALILKSYLDTHVLQNNNLEYDRYNRGF